MTLPRTILAALLAAALPVVGAGPAAAQATSPAPQAVVPTAQLSLAATFSDKGATIPSGVKWRVFRVRNDETGEMPIVGESDEPAPSFALPPGVYIVHAAYGLAAATRRVEIGAAPVHEVLALDCGALKVEGTIGDKRLPPEQLSSRIYLMMPSGDRRLIAEDVSATDDARLPAGRYFIENSYGNSNASVSAEIDIKAGQLTDATFHHNAATLTLKLVNQPGGEALADTAWSVLTPGGDVIRESIGAFPSMILAEGNYTVVARHDGRVYTREFEVKSGLDQDVEVLSK